MKNLAIAGLGVWGRNLVESVQNVSPSVRFTVGVSGRHDELDAFSKKNQLRVVASLREALASQDVDGVVIATPDRMHPFQLAEAVRAGKPALVEKPFALDLKSASAALSAARAAGVLVSFAHNRRFLPAVAKIRDFISADLLGQILHIEGNFSSNYGLRLTQGVWRADRTDTIAGGMTGMGIHQIDLMIAIAGPISRLYARGKRQLLKVEIDDNVGVLLDFESGATGALTSLITTPPIWRLRIQGSKGWCEMLGERNLLLFEGMGPAKSVEFDYFSTERAEIEAFAAAMQGDTRFPVPENEVLQGIAALEAVATSLTENRSVAIGVQV
jgi:predicted dehydrogenase